MTPNALGYADVVREFYDTDGDVQFEYSSRESRECCMSVDLVDYVIRKDECLLTEKPKDLPDHYFTGKDDPREYCHLVPLGSLWHDTDVGILKRLITAPNRDAQSGRYPVLWENAVGHKYVVDADNKIVGRIVPKVNFVLNPKTNSNGSVIDVTQIVFSPDDEPPKTSKYSLKELLDIVEKGEEI